MFDCRCGKQFQEKGVDPDDVKPQFFPFVSLIYYLHSEVSKNSHQWLPVKVKLHPFAEEAWQPVYGKKNGGQKTRTN
ncbi:hypothetical protein Y1Q_0006076 [Alligator mississippiensis]|uniref:Uncharacterized protein n=1 Tax=Alligator mississippiensis TaxID=8496 RepID=A0A151N3Y8_ALLMI|nr:hypothetical protein Y1Q_0006076 [Alligator mississippiensis]